MGGLLGSVWEVTTIISKILETSSAQGSKTLQQSVDGVQVAWVENKWSNITLPVFDLINVEEGSKFEVMVGEGTVITHNCGFGMGYKVFLTTCLNEGLEIEESLAKLSISTYRSTYTGVPRVWKEVGDAFRSAMEGENCSVRGLLFKKEVVMCRNCVCVYLYSGRKIIYWEPEMAAGKFGQEIQVKLKLMGGQMGRRKTWGGDIFQDVVQGIARDLMCYGSRAAAQKGFDIIATVHDEALGIGDKDRDLQEFIDAFSQKPDWANGCPVEASGWKGQYYRKD